MRKRRWAARPAPFPYPDPSGLQVPEGLTASVAAVLASRGISGEALEGYLSPDISRMAPWDSLPGAREAASVIVDSIREGRRIIVHGDFDADGITATALVCTALSRFGADAGYHIPDRFADGYGLGDSGVTACRSAGAGLMMTVDCGITAVEQVKALRNLGIRTVITDHHRPDAGLPDADAIASPVLGDPDSPHGDLSGAGTAWLVMRGVSSIMGHGEGAVDDLLQLAAAGTVCDVVSLTGTNRLITASGLSSMRVSPLPGIAALADSASVAPGSISSRDIAFRLGPRLNSCGRMGNAGLAVELLLARDTGTASSLASQVAETDRDRRRLDGLVRSQAESMASRLDHPACIVLWSGEWHRGVIGIAASRLADEYGVPSLLFSVEEGMAHGSARSVPGVSIHDVLSRVQAETGMLDRFGGHHMAAGLGLPADRLPEFARILQRELSDSGTGSLPGPVLHVDGRLEEAELTLDTVRALGRMEPFGEGNREPVWLARGAWPLTWRAVGKSRDHLSCIFRVGGTEVRAIGFGLADRQSLFGARVDLAFTLAEDTWRGDGGVQLRLKDIRRTSGAGRG